MTNKQDKNIERISDDLFISHSENQKELVSWDGNIQMDIDDIYYLIY